MMVTRWRRFPTIVHSNHHVRKGRGPQPKPAGEWFWAGPASDPRPNRSRLPPRGRRRSRNGREKSPPAERGRGWPNEMNAFPYARESSGRRRKKKRTKHTTAPATRVPGRDERPGAALGGPRRDPGRVRPTRSIDYATKAGSRASPGTPASIREPRTPREPGAPKKRFWRRRAPEPGRSALPSPTPIERRGIVENRKRKHIEWGFWGTKTIPPRRPHAPPGSDRVTSKTAPCCFW
jgi:hypothetical protein